MPGDSHLMGPGPCVREFGRDMLRDEDQEVIDRLRDELARVKVLEDKLKQPFFQYDAAGGVIFCAARTDQGILVSGSGAMLSPERARQFLEWLKAATAPVGGC